MRNLYLLLFTACYETKENPVTFEESTTTEEIEETDSTDEPAEESQEESQEEENENTSENMHFLGD